MEVKQPFVKLFRTVEQYYVFDVNTNSIIRVKEKTYREIEDLLSCGNTESEDIKKLIERGYLKPNGENIQITHPATQMVEKYLEGSIGQLILQVTQNCNLRCNYCVYSGSYINRVHTNKRMSFELAKRAVDFYFQRSYNKSNAIIGFYGGEPLLEMELIEKVVEYSKKLFEGKELKFNLTTNATLLAGEVLDYLYAHNISLTISLDGPKEIHDQSRVFADNQTGTFQKIMDNLEEIEKQHPDYMKNISFNAVLDTQNDFQCSSDFFTYDFIKDALVNIATLNENGVKDEIKYSEAFGMNYRYELFKCYLNRIGRLEYKYVSKIINNQVEFLKTMIHERISLPYNRGTVCHPSGPCIAGAMRLFVTADGKFYPCERVNEASNAFVIGNIEDGFDIEQIKKLLNVGTLTAEQCRKCWAIEHCSNCAAGIDDGDKLCADKKLARCAGIKENCELRLIEYCTLREMGYQFE